MKPEDLKAEDLAVDLRGYEVARLEKWGWEVCSKHSPSASGHRSAIDNAKWLNDRQAARGAEPNHEVRVIVSMRVPTPVVEEHPESNQLELPLETEVAVAEARVANGEYDVVERTP